MMMISMVVIKGKECCYNRLLSTGRLRCCLESNWPQIFNDCCREENFWCLSQQNRRSANIQVRFQLSLKKLSSSLKKLSPAGKLSFWKSLGATQTSSNSWMSIGRRMTKTSTWCLSSWRRTCTMWSRRGTSWRGSTDSTSCISYSRWRICQLYSIRTISLWH